MQCPNCRKIEKGQWLYANGCRSFPDFSMDDWTHEEDLYDLSYSEMVSNYLLSIGMSTPLRVLMAILDHRGIEEGRRRS